MTTDTNGPTALVADDDAVSRRLLTMVLQRQRFRVVVAEDGCGALHMLTTEQPALVFLDAHMPAPDGYEVCRRIRGQRREPSPHVIMVTAAGQESDRILALAAGVDEFITKPFSPSKLLALLDTLRDELDP